LCSYTYTHTHTHRLNATEECLACFDEMVFYGVKPSTRTYDGVLGMYIHTYTHTHTHISKIRHASTFSSIHAHTHSFLPSFIPLLPHSLPFPFYTHTHTHTHTSIYRCSRRRRPLASLQHVPPADAKGRSEAQRHHLRVGNKRSRTGAGLGGSVKIV
jgi:hypothetical protein